MAAMEIGSLFVALGLDSAAFTSGVKRVQGVTGKLQKGLEGMATKAEALGQKLSIVSGAMAAFGLAAGGLVKHTADAAGEIRRQSALANASTTEFQRMAAGAKKVGIDQEKLADILKDVNDRVGDFLQTGGGPMADFFEKVAPQVGVTADQFRNLSGPDALQLYVSSLEKAGLSQQEMTFYLEAIASDATALIPLLKNGGAEMTRLGDAAQASGAVMSEGLIAKSKEFSDKLSALGQALEGVKNRLAEALLPIINSFLDTLTTKGVPALQSMVEGIEGLIQWFGGLSQPVQEAAAVIAAALGVGGPVLLAVSAVSRAFAMLLGTGPIGLFIGAASLAVAAWQVWGDDIKAAVGVAIDWLSAKFQEVVDWLKSIIEWAGKVKTAITDALAVGRDEMNSGEGYSGMAGAMGDPAAMFGGGSQSGGSVADGLVRGFQRGMAAGQGDIEAAIQEHLLDATNDKLGIRSPSRVFAEIGRFITEGLGLGIRDGLPQARQAMGEVADVVVEEGAKEPANEFRDAFKSAFQQVAFAGASLGDALRSSLSGWAGGVASSLFSSAFDGLWSAFGLPEFANGTNNFAGGLARVNERGGEIMNLPRGTQIIPHDISKRMADNAGIAGAFDVTVTMDASTGALGAFVADRAGRVVAQATPRIVQQSVAATDRAMKSTKTFGAR